MSFPCSVLRSPVKEGTLAPPSVAQRRRVPLPAGRQAAPRTHLIQVPSVFPAKVDVNS